MISAREPKARELISPPNEHNILRIQQDILTPNKIFLLMRFPTSVNLTITINSEPFASIEQGVGYLLFYCKHIITFSTLPTFSFVPSLSLDFFAEVLKLNHENIIAGINTFRLKTEVVFNSWNKLRNTSTWKPASFTFIHHKGTLCLAFQSEQDLWSDRFFNCSTP